MSVQFDDEQEEAMSVSGSLAQTANKELAMLVTFHTKPEYRQEFKKTLGDDLENAREETGNLSMLLYQAKDDSETCFFFERWDDRNSLNEHLEKPYTKAVLDLSEKALTTPMEILYLNDLFPLSPADYSRSPEKPGEAVELIVIFKVKEGEQSKFIKQFENSVSKSRSEAGCVAFHIHAVEGKTDKYALYERWENQAAFDSHLEQPYTKELFAVFKEVLEKPAEESMTFLSLIQ